MSHEAVIFMGIQATGKSTFYSTRFHSTHVRINLDMLRTRHRETILVNACLEAKQSFVIDNTNPTKLERARYLLPARQHGFSTVGYYFQSKITEAISRNATRDAAHRIPEIGIRGAHAKLELPEFGEQFDELYYVALNDGGEFSITPWSNEI